MIYISPEPLIPRPRDDQLFPWQLDECIPAMKYVVKEIISCANMHMGIFEHCWNVVYRLQANNPCNVAEGLIVS